MTTLNEILRRYGATTDPMVAAVFVYAVANGITERLRDCPKFGDAPSLTAKRPQHLSAAQYRELSNLGWGVGYHAAGDTDPMRLLGRLVDRVATVGGDLP